MSTSAVAQNVNVYSDQGQTNLVSTHTTIQDAIDNATAGNVIEVLSATHAEGQIVVDKSLTIQGQGAANTTVLSDYNTATTDHGNDASAWIRTEPGTNVVIRNLTLDGNGNITQTALRFKDGGNVDGVSFNDIINGNYGGIAVQVQDGNVVIENSTFTNIGRIGAHYRAGVIPSATISGLYKNNTYVGKGAGDWLDYALDISGAVTVSVEDNDISNNIGVAASDGSSSAGVLVTSYFPTPINTVANNVTITGNSLTGNTAGVAVGYDANDISVVSINENDISGNDFGVTTTGPLVNAANNYWGSVDGPSGFAPGSGDEIVAGINACPFYNGPTISGSLVDCPIQNVNTSDFYYTIQAAIDDATAEDEIEILSADFTEPGQIVVDRDILLKGSGIANTILRPGMDTGTGGDARAFILVNSGVTLNLKDLTIDGSGRLIYQAVRQKGDGLIENVKFTQIKYNESGPDYQGVAVAAFGSGNVAVTNSQFIEIGRIGVLYFGTNINGSTYTNNTYVGKGSGDWLDYAVDISAGAVVNVTNNSISENTGVASSDGSTSAGVLVSTFFAAGTEAAISNNIITNNTSGVAVGFDASDISVVTINENDLSGNDFGVTSTAPAVDATCNWFGTAVFSDIASNVTGPVTFVPYLNDGTDDDAGTAGFQPVAGSCIDGPVRVYSDAALTVLVSSHITIQSAIDDVTTLDGYFVQVDAGSYDEGISIDKSLTIVGPNELLSPNSGTRVAEAILAPTGADVQAIQGSAPNKTIVIRGITINMSGATGNARFATQISQDGTSWTFEHNIFTNSTGAINGDIYFSGNQSVTFNLIDNLIKDGNVSNGFSFWSAQPHVFNISGNVWQDNKAWALNLNRATGIIANNIVRNTSVTGPNWYDDQLGFIIATPDNDLTIIGNSFENIPHNALVIYDNFDGVLNITNNEFIDVGQNRVDIAIGTAAIRFRDSGGIFGNLAGISVSENNFINNITAVDNNSGQTLSALCNYWGSSDIPTIESSIVGGDVNFVPFLNNGTDDDPGTAGFQPVPGSCVGGPVRVYSDAALLSQISGHTTIQDAIDAGTTLDGYFVTADAGNYDEVLNINKSLTILGPNAGLDCDSRSAEAIIAPAAGTPATITADGVTLNGFEITAPDAFYAINLGGTSNTSVVFNNIHDIGTNKSGGGNVHAILYTVGSSNTNTIAIEDNCLNNISSSSLSGSSASAIGILQSTSTGVLDGVNIVRNAISNVNVNTGTWPTGKIAYGIQINVAGGSGFASSTGNAKNAVIAFNDISDIEGFIATAIALEGNTENASVENNNVWNLSAYKSANRAGGGLDLNGLKFENNSHVSTVTVQNNSFQTNTFVHNGSPDMGYAVANYVDETTGGTATLICNWLGTTDEGVLEGTNDLDGKLFTKVGAEISYLSFLFDDSENNPGQVGFDPAGICTLPNSASFVLTPSVTTAATCDEFTVMVSVETDVELNLAEARMTFPASELEVVSITAPDDSPLPAAPLTQTIEGAQFDNVNGTLSYKAQLNGNSGFPSTDFDFFKITFKVKGNTGSATLTPVLAPVFPSSVIAISGFQDGIAVNVNLLDEFNPISVDLTPDVTDPEVICVGDQSVNTDAGQCYYTVQGAEFDPVSTDDNCEVTAVTNDFNGLSTLAGAQIPNGTVVMWTAVDAAGNTGSCSFEVTVVDNEDPVANCKPVTIQLNGLGVAIITASQVNDNSTDNCGIASESVNQINFDCSHIGDNTITLTITDVNGRVSTCTATVTVEDNVAPTATCRNVTVELDSNGDGTLLASALDNGSSDNCGPVSLGVLGCPDDLTFDQNVTSDVIFGSGNGNGAFTVDNGNNVELGLRAKVRFPNPSGTYNSNGDGSYNHLAGAFGSGGVQSGWNFEWSINTDQDGTTSQSLDALTYELGLDFDPTDGVNFQVFDPINLPYADHAIGDNSTLNGGGTVASNGDFAGYASLIANNSLAQNSWRHNFFGAFDGTVDGRYDVYLKAFDGLGNEVAATAITVIVGAGTGNAYAGCLMPIDSKDYDCADVGTTTETLVVIDASGNSSTCTANVTVEDNIAPEALCVGSYTVVLDASGNGTLSPNDIDNGSNDACGAVSLSLDRTVFDCSDVTLQTSGGAPLIITGVVDGPLTGGTPKAIELFVAEDIADLSAFGIGSANNGGGSGGEELTLSGSATAGSFLYVASESTQFTNFFGFAPDFTTSAAAINGNDAIELFQNGVVIDTFGDINTDGTGQPWEYLDGWAYRSIETGPDGSTFELGNWSFSGPNSLDGETSNATAATPFPIGTYTPAPAPGIEVTLTVTDVNGNESTCTSEITVISTTMPVVACSNITVQLDVNGVASIVADDIDNGSTASCPIASRTIDVDQFTCADVGANTVTLTVTDVNGNEDSCTAIVTVEDNIAPSVSCQDITVQLDGSGAASIVGGDVDNGSNDACGIALLTVSPSSFTCSEVGANTVTLTVTDNNGNTSTCTATVTVEDNIAPSASCQNVTVQLDANGEASIVAADVNGGSSDACGISDVCLLTEVSQEVVTGTLDVGGSTFEYFDDNRTEEVCFEASSFGCCGLIAGVHPYVTDVVTITQAGVYTFTLTDINSNVDFAGAIYSAPLNPTNICENLIANDDDSNPVGGLDPEITISVNLVPGTYYLETFTFDINENFPAPYSWNIELAECTSEITYTCANIGANTVELLVTDNNGNISTCTATVTVEDVSAPSITCAPDAERFVSVLGNYVVIGNEFDPTSILDNCGANLTVSHNAAALLFDDQGLGDNTSLADWAIPVGVHTITFTVSDGTNTATCDIEVTVKDLSLSGEVNMNLSCTPLPIRVELYEAGTPNASPILVETYTSVVDANGDFALDLAGIAPGTYGIYIKVDTYLQQFVGDQVISGATTGINLTNLIPGDIAGAPFGDNGVGGADLALLIAAYNTQIGDGAYNARADLDCNGQVDGLDMSLLIFFYGQLGDFPQQ